jgi:C1A family cysteine protease
MKIKAKYILILFASLFIHTAIHSQVLNPIMVQKELKISPILKKQLDADRAILAMRNVKFVIGVTDVSQQKSVQSYTGAIRVAKNVVYNSNLNKIYSKNKSATPITKVYSMRSSNLVTPIRNQGYCGSCWDFALLACAETNYLFKNPSVDPNTLNFSEQQVICQSNAGSCHGGASSTAAKWLFEKKVSILSEDNMPYKSSLPKAGNEKENCPTILTSVFGAKFKVVDYGVLPNEPGKDHASVLDIKNAILEHGAVTAAFWADSLVFAQIFSKVGGGVYEEQEPLYTPENYTPKPKGHEIAIIGWDDNDQCWIIKNSWGTGWGDSGFGRIKYGTSNIGSDATWVEVEKITTRPVPTNNLPVNEPIKPVKPIIRKQF